MPKLNAKHLNLNAKRGFTLIELLVARHPKPWRRKAILSGFTLIELLVVVAIIGILITMITASFFTARKIARDTARKSDLKAVQQALELYFQANGKYPHPVLNWCTQISNPAYPQVKNALEPTFISKIPKDPITPSGSNDYFYAGTNPYTYSLYSTLENTGDQEYIANALSADGLLGCAGGNSNYHYKVTNP